MAEFCLNTLCLKYVNESEKMCVQNMLDETLSFLTDTWKRHKKLTRRELCLYVDVNPKQQGLFNYKEYCNELRTRSKMGFSKLRNLLIALTKIQVHAPYYDDPCFDDDSLENLCDKSVCILYDKSAVKKLCISDCDSDATIFCFACQKMAYMLSLANAIFWKKEKISFVVFDKIGSFTNNSVDNVCIHDNNKKIIEKKFFPISIADEAYFVRTGHKSQGQEIYREVETGYYWYLDNKHKDHFEVFSASYIHLGTADIDTYVLDTDNAVSGRNIRDEFS